MSRPWVKRARSFWSEMCFRVMLKTLERLLAGTLDWEFFLASLSDREKSIVEKLLAGLNGSEIARSLKVDPSTIRYFKQRLAVKILEHFGQGILRVIVQRPGWKNGLDVCAGEVGV